MSFARAGVTCACVAHFSLARCFGNRYGLCERKVGKPMPAENDVVAEARLLIGLRMVPVQDIFEDYKEKVDNAVRDR